MSAPRTPITDHALVRWIERTGTADMQALREAVGQSLARAIAAAGEIGVRDYLILADGLVYVMDGDTCITVLEEDGRHARIHAFASRQRPNVLRSDGQD